MKFKTFDPPKGGLNRLRGSLDQKESEVLFGFRWFWMTPVGLLALAIMVFPPQRSVSSSSFSRLIALYENKAQEWSPSTALKEVKISSSGTRFYWYN